MKIFLILLCVCGIAFFAACNKTEDNNFMKNKDMTRKINATPIETLSNAAINGDIEKVKKLIATGNITDDSYNEALNFAAEQGYTEIVKLLIESGADVNANSNIAMYNSYPLTLAAINGHEDIVKFLITQGADVNAKNIISIPTDLIKKNKGVYYQETALFECSVLNILEGRKKQGIFKGKNFENIIKILKDAGAKDTEKFLKTEYYKEQNTRNIE